jgi:hypothetical protein
MPGSLGFLWFRVKRPAAYWGMEELARSIQEQLWSSLVGSLTLTLRELIDGLSSDCHDDSSPRKYQNVYVVLA